MALECERLNFNLSAALKEVVTLAKRNVDVLVQDVQMNSFTFDKFGKEDIKALKLSPDSFIQIAIQMAFIRYCCRFSIYSQKMYLTIIWLALGCMDILLPITNLLPPENSTAEERRPSEAVFQKLSILPIFT